MPGQTFPEPKLTSSIWNAQPVSHWCLVPGGGQLDLTKTMAWWNALPAERRRTPYITIPSGTLVGRSNADRNAQPQVGFSPQVDENTEQIYILAFDVENFDRETGIELLIYEKSFVVYENKLPGWADMSDALKARVRQLYHCILMIEPAHTASIRQ